MNPIDDTTLLFPIRELVRRTGVNASTLRAWEHRHGLIAPVRAPSGHRLYSLEDVARVRRTRELLAQGLGLGQILPLLAEGELTQSGDDDVAGSWSGQVSEMLRALEGFDSERLDRVYGQTCALYPIDQVTEGLLLPVLDVLGERWAQRLSGIAEEHFFCAWLRNKLGARLHHASGAARGRPLILACLPGEQHEIGLLIFALAAVHGGYRVIYLGANMPTRDISHVADKTRPAAIVLAGRRVPVPDERLADIGWLVAHAEAPVCVGSHISEQCRQELTSMGAVVLGEDVSLGLARLARRLGTGN